MEIIATPAAPAAVGPYAQAVRAGNLLFCSGQIPLHPETGQLVGEDIDAQTRQVLANLAAVLLAGGARRDQVAKTTVYLTDLDDFAAMNEIYAEFFGHHRPARATVQVARLPRQARIEIDCLAVL